ncbi:MAG TPA: Rieske 2Fe-2S domain-containing protein [Terriglobia bacterium]|nr:Rieske 2Fe-2S domain-containing protein [Terriglobia bacterium]
MPEDAHGSASLKSASTTPSIPKPQSPAAAAPPAKPVAAAPKAAAPPEPNVMRRRIIWTCLWGFVAATLLMFLRFFFPRALFEPETVHNIGYPGDFAIGVNEKYKQAYRIWVVKEPPRLFVIFGKCTHLGCTPDWKPAENKFKCPCHGSGYTPEGINFEGPAPRPMDRAHVELNAQGQIIVDTSQLYSWFKAQGGVDHFEDPGAYITI